jgi:hypothetical protein
MANKVFFLLGCWLLLVACGSGRQQLKKPYAFYIPVTVVVYPADEGIMSPPIAGRAYCENNLVVVEGYLYKEKIIIRNRSALGHEIANLLHCQYKDVFFNHELLKEY